MVWVPSAILSDGMRLVFNHASDGHIRRRRMTCYLQIELPAMLHEPVVAGEVNIVVKGVMQIVRETSIFEAQFQVVTCSTVSDVSIIASG